MSEPQLELMRLYFALQSGQEHRRLQYWPSQVTLFDPPGGHAYLVYQEDIYLRLTKVVLNT